MRSFEKHIKNKANAFQLDPLPDSFDQVMAALEKKKKRRFLFWIWWVFPGILLAGGSTCLYYFYPVSHYSASAQVVKTLPSHTLFHHPVHHIREASTSSERSSENMQEHTEEIKTSIHTSLVDYTEKTTNRHTETLTRQGIQNPLYTTTDINKQVIENKKDEPESQQSTQAENRQDTLVKSSFPASVQIPLSVPVLSIQKVAHIHTDTPTIKTDHFKRFSIGAYTDLGVTKSNYENNVYVMGSSGTSPLFSSYTSSRQATDKFLFTYSAGLQFRYNPFRFLAVETGVGFTRVESYQIVTNGGSPFTGLYTLATFSSGAQEYRNIYDYITIPIKVYYQKKWSWIGTEAGAGISFDVPVHTQSYVVNDSSGLSFYHDKLNGSRLNQFGIGVSVQAHAVFYVKNFSFFAGPIFKYRLNSMFDKNYAIRQYNYFIGAEIGIRYNF